MDWNEEGMQFTKKEKFMQDTAITTVRQEIFTSFSYSRVDLLAQGIAWKN